MKFSIPKAALVLISIVVGALFLFSAYAKTSPVDTFTNIIFSRISISWSMASAVARFFIGLEAGIGLLLLFYIHGKRKWVLYLTLFVLIIFSGYLAGLWYTDGNDVDCGCMGNIVKMSPMWSLVKNAVLLILTGILIRFSGKQQSNGKNALACVAMLVLMALPFVLYPNKLDIEKVYEGKSVAPQDDLRKGKHVVAFLSLTCPHCKAAAYYMDSLKLADPALPLHVVFMDRDDKDSLLTEFKKVTKMEHIPYDFLEQKKFISLAGEYVPAIYLLNGEKVEDRIDPDQLTRARLDAWLKD